MDSEIALLFAALTWDRHCLVALANRTLCDVGAGLAAAERCAARAAARPHDDRTAIIPSIGGAGFRIDEFCAGEPTLSDANRALLLRSVAPVLPPLDVVRRSLQQVVATSTGLGRAAAAPHIFIGARYPAQQPGLLRMNGITHVLCCFNDRVPNDLTSRYGIARRTLPAEDADDADLEPLLPVAFEFMDEALHGGGSVLVHCAAGMHRSPFFVAAYLVARLGLPVNAALESVSAARPMAVPRPAWRPLLEALAGEAKSSPLEPT